MPIALVRDAGGGAIAAENELRKIKIAISQFDAQKPTRTIGVTSPNANDGKTTIAYSLALLTAQGGNRTLLIDANTHNPTLARAFSEAGSDSLTRCLTGAEDGLTVVRLADNLSFIGQHKLGVSAHPADVLGSEAMQRALHRVQQSFDYIIVDLPAMLDHVEARAIAPLLDRILIVSLWGSPISDLERCVENSDALASRILGIVINKSPDVRRKGVVRPIKTPEKAEVVV
jgi:Mrp family chromosome partitioning ATPase